MAIILVQVVATYPYAKAQEATALVLDQPPTTVTVGDTVIFTGQLFTADYQYVIQGATTWIKDNDPLTADDILVSGITDENGEFAIEWIAEFTDVDDTVDVYAVFEGAPSFDDARSQEYSVTVLETESQQPVEIVPEIIFDKNSYLANDSGIISIIAPDDNLESNRIESIQARLWSSTDPTGLLLTLTETGANTGIFEADFSLTTEGRSSGTVLRVSLGDTIEAEYKDSFASASIESGITGGPAGTLTVKIDKTSYTLGETVRISGTVPAVIEGVPVVIQVFNPNNEMYTIGQPTPSRDGTYSFEFSISGKLGINGIYTVKATYSGQTVQTTFQFTAGTSVSKFQIEIELGSANAGSGKSFNPKQITIPVGATVVWVNKDSAGHTVTSGNPSDYDAGSRFDSTEDPAGFLIKPGATWQHTFDTAGEFPYFCQVHPWTTGKVIVGSTKPTQITETSISFFTDKTSYNIGEKVTIFGEVPAVVQDEILLRLYDSNGILVGEGTVSVYPDGSFGATFTLEQGDPTGSWRATASYGGQTSSITFAVLSPKIVTEQKTTKVTFQGQVFDVKTSLSNGKINSIQVDPDFISIIILITQVADGKLEITLPRNLIDAKIDGQDDTFIILVDGKETSFSEIENKKDYRTLRVDLFANEETVEIIGTKVGSRIIKEVSTILQLNVPPAKLSVGDVVTFSGFLKGSNGITLQNALVWIKDRDSLSFGEILGSGITDAKGKFEIEWIADYTDVDDTVDLYASFEGGFSSIDNTVYSASVTNEYPISIKERQGRIISTTLSDEAYIGLYGVWEQEPLNVHIFRESQQISSSYVSDVINALNEWSDLLRVQSNNYNVWNFKTVTDPRQQLYSTSVPDISIVVKADDEGRACVDKYAGLATFTSGITLAQRLIPSVNVEVLVSCTGQPWSHERVTSIALHEIGHALGLGHTYNKDNDLMCSVDQFGNPTCAVKNYFAHPEEFHLQALLFLYGNDGFAEPNRSDIPEKFQLGVEQVPIYSLRISTDKGTYITNEKASIIIEIVDTRGNHVDIKQPIATLNGNAVSVTKIATGKYSYTTNALSPGLYTFNVKVGDSSATATIQVRQTMTTDIRISTDRLSYETDDMITISGKVTGAKGGQVEIRIVNPRGEILTTRSVQVAQDGSFTFSSKISGSLAISGTYIAEASYGGQTTRSEFLVIETVEPISTIRLSTDKESYFIGDSVVVTGTVSEVIQNLALSVQVMNPQGEIFLARQLSPSLDGKYQLDFMIDGSLAVSGTYTIKVIYSGTSEQNFNVLRQPSMDDVTIDVKASQLYYGVDDTVIISGKVSSILTSKTVGIEVLSPEGRIYKTATASLDSNGNFEYRFQIMESKLTVPGTYKIAVQYGGGSATTAYTIKESDMPTPPKKAEISSVVDVKVTAKQVRDLVLIRLKNTDDSTVKIAGLIIKTSDAVIEACKGATSAWRAESCTPNGVIFFTKDDPIAPNEKGVFRIKVTADRPNLSWEVYDAGRNILEKGSLKPFTFTK